MSKTNRTPIVSIIAACGLVVGASIMGASLFSGPASVPRAEASLVHHAIVVADQSEYGTAGSDAAINVELAHRAGDFYAKASADLAAQAAAEKAAQAARDSRARRTTSTVGASVQHGPSHDDSQFTDSDFDNVATCETGQNWQHQGGGPNGGFDGGLGIYHPNWIHDGGLQYAPFGSQATREQQILIARQHVREFGIMGWGCHSHFYDS